MKELDISSRFESSGTGEQPKGPTIMAHYLTLAVDCLLQTKKIAQFARLTQPRRGIARLNMVSLGHVSALPQLQLLIRNHHRRCAQRQFSLAHLPVSRMASGQSVFQHCF